MLIDCNKSTYGDDYVRKSYYIYSVNQTQMKQISVIILLVTTAFTRSGGQTFEYRQKSGSSNSHVRITTGEREGYHLCQESRIGFGLSAGGILVGSVGIGILKAYSDNADLPTDRQMRTTGIALWVAGGVIGIVGAVFAIDGSADDIHRFYHNKTYSLISNKPNEVGLALNFR